MISEQRPHPEFSSLIEKFWLLPNNGGAERQSFEILPDANFDLVFMVDDFRCRLILAGPYTVAATVPLFAGYDYFTVRFRPGILPHFAEVKPAELVNHLVELDRLHGADLDSLGELLHAAPDLAGKQVVMEDFFRKVGLRAKVRADITPRAAALVEKTGGQLKVAELAALLDVHVRKLERRFLEETGLSPKTFIRMVRFQSSLARLRSGGEASGLADIAYSSGFADQSHFTRELKNLTGRPPSRL